MDSIIIFSSLHYTLSSNDNIILFKIHSYFLGIRLFSVFSILHSTEYFHASRFCYSEIFYLRLNCLSIKIYKTIDLRNTYKYFPMSLGILSSCLIFFFSVVGQKDQKRFFK